MKQQPQFPVLAFHGDQHLIHSLGWHLAMPDRAFSCEWVPQKGEGVTAPAPLHPLMHIRLVDLSASVVTAWAANEAKTRPTPARLAWRLLRAFLTWCNEHPTYAPLLASDNLAKTRKTREALGRPGTKSDALQREQLPAWFAAVRQIGNPAITAYLQTLLLTGARPGEVLALRWDDVNAAWRGLTIHDKVEKARASYR